MLNVLTHDVVPFLLIVNIIAIVHVAGHYIGARFCKERICSITFGILPIWAFNVMTTEIKIGIIPIGIFLKLNDNEEKNNYLSVVPKIMGPILSIVAAFVTIYMLVIVIGTPVYQPSKIEYTDLGAFVSMIVTSRILFHGVFIDQYIVHLFPGGHLAFMCLAAIWSAKLGIINLVPVPGLDGCSVVRSCFVAMLGVERGKAYSHNLVQYGIIPLALVLLFVYMYDDLRHLRVVEFIRGLIS